MRDVSDGDSLMNDGPTMGDGNVDLMDWGDELG